MSPKDSPKQTGANRITIRNVAAHAGVSVAAVSKVMRNAYGVSDEMREKVTTSIGELNYRPSKAARGLRAGRTFTVGLLLVDIHNPFLPDVIAGMNDELIPSHYQAMIGVGHSQALLEINLIESMIDYKMDGLILVAPRLSADIVEQFAAQIAIVTIGYYHSAPKGFDLINANDQQGAGIAVRALIGQGYRDIAMFTLGTYEGYKASVIQEREIGYLNAMEQAGLVAQSRILEIPYTSPAREIEIDRLLAAPDRPRAIFCWSDLDAVTVLATAARMHIRVPDDLAIVGFDNSTVAALPMVGLTSIDQIGRELGRQAARTLLSRIEGRQKSVRLYTEPKLVYRRSI